MLLTNKYIQDLRDKNHLNISYEQEVAILNLFGVEPDDENEWTEQDIYEQIRIMLH